VISSGPSGTGCSSTCPWTPSWAGSAVHRRTRTADRVVVPPNKTGLPPPLSLLRQDRDTVADFKTRMVELLGCVSHEEASVLRRVSLTFTMHGF
jgi:hypothetical protein